MENYKLKFKDELKIETTNHTNNTNIKYSSGFLVKNKKLFVKFVQFVVKKWSVLENSKNLCALCVLCGSIFFEKQKVDCSYYKEFGFLLVSCLRFSLN